MTLVPVVCITWRQLSITGISHTEALQQLLLNVVSLETCGVTWAPGRLEGQAIVVAIGRYSIQIYDTNKVRLYK